MGKLSDTLLADGTFSNVIADCSAVVNQEIKGKGLGIRTVFKLANSAKPGVVDKALNALMPDFARELDPVYDDYTASDSTSFAQYVSLNADKVATSMLNVTMPTEAFNDRIIDPILHSFRRNV